MCIRDRVENVLVCSIAFSLQCSKIIQTYWFCRSMQYIYCYCALFRLCVKQTVVLFSNTLEHIVSLSLIHILFILINKEVCIKVVFLFFMQSLKSTVVCLQKIKICFYIIILLNITRNGFLYKQIQFTTRLAEYDVKTGCNKSKKNLRINYWEGMARRCV